MADEATREELDELAAIQRKSFEASEVGRNLPAALTLIDEFFARCPSLRLRTELLAHRALLLEFAGRLDEARVSLLDAHALEDSGSRRFGIELGLMQIAEKAGDDEERLHWCRAAFKTVAADPATNGVPIARTLLAMSGGVDALSPDERTDLERIIRNGWRVLELPGEPDLANVLATLDRLQGYLPRPGR